MAVIERCILRHTLAFCLDWMSAVFAGIREADQLDILIALALWNANTHHLDDDLRKRVAICFSPSLIPLEKMRSTSRSAIARFLNLPVETVRRRVDGMIAGGTIVEREGGLVGYAASRMFDTRGRAIARANVDAFARFYLDLVADGIELAPADWLERLPGGGARTRPEWTRAIMRTSAEFVLLATSEALAAFGLGFSTLRVLLTVLRLNIASIEEPLTELRGVAVYPDELRRPVSSANVRRSLHMPHATVHRKLADLRRRGMVMAERGGQIVPGKVLQNPVFASALASHKALAVRRMFLSLHALSEYRLAVQARRIVHA